MSRAKKLDRKRGKNKHDLHGQLSGKTISNVQRKIFSNNSKYKLKILYCNARSVRNKMDELKGIVAMEDIDIIGITESWAYKDDSLLLELNGFSMFRQDRLERKGGGVLIYIRDYLCCREVKFSSKPEAIETVWAEITHQHGKKLIIGNIYRPPNTCILQDQIMFGHITEACKSGEIVLMGDFNFPNIDWDDNVAVNDREAGFLDVIQDSFLQQMVHQGTRDSAILDLIFCSNGERIDNLTIGEHLGDSDHNNIRFEIILKTKKIDTKRLVPNFKKANFAGLKSEFTEVFQEGLKLKHVEDQWGNFKDYITLTVKKHIPFVQKGKALKLYPMWFTKETKKALKDKQRAFSILKQTGSNENRIKYKKTRKHYKYISRKQKKGLELKLANEIDINPKGFFAYARGNKRTDIQLGPLQDCQGNLVDDDMGMANILNKFFGSVFNGDYKCEDCILEFKNDQEILDLKFNREEIIYYLKHVKPFKAPGPDDIYPKVLIECAEELGDVLFSIFECSYNSGVVPMDWKLANITPLFKKGIKSDSGNYRPVSLTSVICKIFETIVKNHITDYLENEGLLSKHQYGFRKGKSCTTNLLDFYNCVTKELDLRNSVDIVYIDFQKAFDKVPHQALLHKLKRIGIQGSTFEWIKNWLVGRKQRVQIKGNYSQWAEVISGVPQGSVLGPLLFIIFIDDITEGLLSKVSIFADDLKIMGIVNTEEQIEQFQADLTRISNWAVKWGMSFNIQKCQVLHLDHKNRNASYYLQGEQIKVGDGVNDLGISISSDLKMGNQCRIASNRANSILGFIKKNVSSRSSDIILPLYRGLVRPHLEYAVQFWSPYLKKDIDLLERVQHRATKIIQGTSGLDYEDRLKKLNMYTLQERRKRGDLIQLFKFIKQNEIEALQFSTEYRTRGHELKLYKSQFNREGRKHYFFNRVVDEWNALPAYIVKSKDVKGFKESLDRHWGIVRNKS